MHREIQIKQFPIVTTHWWPKTRNERFVWENEQYLSFFTSCTQPCPSDPSAHTHPVCDVCARSGSRCIHTGRRRQRLTEGVSEADFPAELQLSTDITQSDWLQHYNTADSKSKQILLGISLLNSGGMPRRRQLDRQLIRPVLGQMGLFCDGISPTAFSVVLREPWDFRRWYHPSVVSKITGTLMSSDQTRWKVENFGHVLNDKFDNACHFY